MKKITICFSLLLCFAVTTLSAQVLTEDFEGGPGIPAGWTNNDLLGNGDSWIIESSGDAALIPPPNGVVYSVSGGAGNYAAFDSDGTSDNSLPEDVALESPTFSCAGLTQVTLEFKHAFAGNFGGSGFVEVSSDGGSNWSTVLTFTEDGYIGGLVTTDVTAQLAGAANAKIRFRWTGDFSVAWYIDEIVVFECAVSAPAPVITPMPMDGATNVALDNSDMNFPNRLFFNWTDGPGDPGGSYTLNLGTQNPPTDNSFTGFPNGDFIFGLTYDTTYFWSVESTNCAGTSTSAIWSFTTEQDPALSIDDNELGTLSVYPNPTKDILNIKTSLDIGNIQVFNLLGQSVAQFNGANLSNKSIDLSSLEDGLYMIEITAGDKRETFKITKN